MNIIRHIYYCCFQTFKYQLSNQPAKWQDIDMTDSVLVDDLHLNDPGEVKVKVKAVNEDNLEGTPVDAICYIDSEAPRLSGTCAIFYLILHLTSTFHDIFYVF